MTIKKIIIIESAHNHRKMWGDVRYTSAKTKKPVILFVHGFKGFKDWGHFNLIADWFAERGFVYTKFNLSHNGTTIDDPVNFVDLEAFANNNFSIELNDLGRIIDHIFSDEFGVPDVEIDKDQLYLIGHSRGGGLTILKANEDSRIKAITTWAAISNLASIWPMEILSQWKSDGVYHVFNSRTGQNMPLSYQLVIDYENNRSRLDIRSAAERISCPWLICHGTADETLDVQIALDLKSRNKNPKLYILDNVTHTFGGGHPYNSNRILKPTIALLEKTRNFFESLRL